jgi:hypothetical protein
MNMTTQAMADFLPVAQKNQLAIPASLAARRINLTTDI